jgi:hypothetical protein
MEPCTANYAILQYRPGSSHYIVMRLSSATLASLLPASNPLQPIISHYNTYQCPRIRPVESKDGAPYQLPASFLLCFFGCFQLIVLGDVPVQGTHHDHGHHSRQEQHDHERVDDRKPMDLVIRHQEVRVPPRCPADVAQLRVWVSSANTRDTGTAWSSTTGVFRSIDRPL